MNFRKAHICISDIDCKDQSFQISTSPVTDELVQSIRDMGLINPPAVLFNNGQYTIICGFRRISACNKLGIENIDMNVVDADPLACAKLAISDNTSQRELNWVEISRALNLVFKHCPDQKQIIAMLPALGLPDNLGVARKALPLSTLPDAIQKGVISGQIPLPIALELGALDPDTGRLLSEIFQELALGLNLQREVLLLVKEIAARESINIMDVLTAKNVRALFADPDLDRTQKRMAFRDHLKTRRYPVIQKAHEAYTRKLKSLKLPAKVRLVAPKNFESRQYTFQIDFATIPQLKTHLELLLQKAQSPELQDLLKGFDPSD